MFHLQFCQQLSVNYDIILPYSDQLWRKNERNWYHQCIGMGGNLAQRDLFGAHTYARIDRPGVFHSDWGSSAIKVVHIK